MLLGKAILYNSNDINRKSNVMVLNQPAAYEQMVRKELRQ